jgi:hypothetical protein
MKALTLFLFGFVCAIAQAATSDLLFPNNTVLLAGTAGNVIFNGSQFVTPTVQNDGAIRLSYLNTNGFVLSNSFLTVTGKSPCVAFDGSNHFLSWLDTN